MVSDITINLLPGIADKERALRERQQLVIFTGVLLVIDGIALFLFLLLTFHSIALNNNVELLNKKIENVKSDIEEFAPLETTYNDLQRRIGLVKGLKDTQHHWIPVIDAIAKVTSRNVQFIKYSLNASSLSIGGVAKTALDLEKQKQALSQAYTQQEYTIKKQDSWKTIAKTFSMEYQSFITLHGIDPTIDPVEGKIIRIKKPIFTSVQITSIADVPVGQPVNFELALGIEKGVVTNAKK